MSGLPTILRPRGGKLDAKGLRAYCEQRAAQGEAAQLYEPLLDLVEQLSERLLLTEMRLGRVLKAQFGRRSEQLDPSHLQLALAGLDCVLPEVQALLDPEPPQPETPPPPRRPSRLRPPRQIPESVPRRLTISDPTPEQMCCGDCGAQKTYIGSDFAELLDWEPGGFFAERTERRKFACRPCQSGVVIGPGPARPLEQSMPGPGLIAQVIVAKYKDHCPLERQSRIFTERYGVPLSPSTLDDWVGGAAQVLQPVAMHILQQIVSGSHISLDDTPVRVLDPKAAQGVKRGHIWSLVGQGAVAYLYTPSWSGKPIRELLEEFEGLLQSDGYAGLQKLFEKKDKAPTRAGCMAHVRRRFVQALEDGDARAAMPLTVIKKLYEIERRATQDGVDEQERQARRQTESRPLMEQLHKVLLSLQPQAPPKTPLGKAVGYALRQWNTLQPFLSDGQVRMDNNHTERTLRPIALGRKNWLFGGSDAGAHWLAIHQTLLGSCELAAIPDPWTYLRDVLTKLACGWPQSRLGELVPAAWLAAQSTES